jgi:hypothetical protein
MNLPNRQQRRKIANEMGLFGKNKQNNEGGEAAERSKAIGKLIHLRNLTEQRNNNNKNHNL